MSTQFNDTKRTLTTGDVVISVAEIFDRLQTKVDPNTLEQLLRDILAGRRSQVRPGELITAELINQILAELESLQVRVTALETLGVTDGKVVITSIPTDPPPRVGQKMDIFGQNFGFSIGAQQVLFDNQVPIGAYLAGSNDQHLIFNIPVIPNIPAGGRPIEIKVSNLTSSDGKTINILPVVQVLESGTDVNFITVDPSTITPNNPAIFKYHLTSRAGITAEYTVTPELTGMANNATVQSQMLVMDDKQAVLENKKITLAPNESKDFFVMIPTIPAGASAITFKLKVTLAASNGVGGFDGPRDFTVGQQVILPDSSIAFTFIDTDLLITPPGGSLDKTTQPFTIRIVRPTQTTPSLSRISIQAAMHIPDTYTATASFVSGNSWNASVNTQLVPNPLQLTEADFVNAKEITKVFRFLITPTTAATNTAEVELKLKREGTPLSQTMRFNLALI
jgi:uncharacterized cupredoxin-like copper-binding protein